MTAPTVTRRDCLRFGLATSGALLVGFGASKAAASTTLSAPAELALWIRIGQDNSVTLLTNATEMGQGSGSALAQILAEELGIEWSDVRISMAPVESAYYSMWNEYQTGGSGSIRGMFEKLRYAGALGRTLLIKVAADRWQVLESSCRVEGCAIAHIQSGQRLGFGSLVSAAATLARPAQVTLTTPEKWRLIGKPLRRVDIEEKTKGAATFGIDVRVPNQLVATISQATTNSSRLVRLNENAARRTSGVKRVVRLENAVAVVASDSWSAQKGLKALAPVWEVARTARTSTGQARHELEAALRRDGTAYVPRGEQEDERRASYAAAMASSTRQITASYEVPLLAHACMEPMNATAHVQESSATLWVPTQHQSKVRRDVASALAMDEASVAIHTTHLGGGFGRRLESDYAVQAALISREVGTPVKLLWSRQEDIQHDFYRPMASARFEAGIAPTGNVTAVRARLAGIGGCEPWGIAGHPYALPNILITTQSVPTSIRLGAWRSVEVNQNTFFLESFVDEIAFATNRSPLDFRRELLGSDARCLRVLNAVARAARIDNGKSRDRHVGIAMTRAFGSICAQVVEISVPKERSVRVHRVVCALDCGTAVNPDTIRAQVEGGIALALSAAALESVSVLDGQVEQSNFHDYPLLRLPQMPDVEVVILESPGEAIGGVGEPPVPPLAPALTNALFAATGERVRALPLTAADWTLV
jgi:isoquinoline 1-oxidoreductase subunit beta